MTREPHTDPRSSATPHMSSVRLHLERLRAAHGRMHDHTEAVVTEAARRHEEQRPTPAPEESQ